MLLYLLVACGWQYHATPQPHLDDKSAGTLNMALRFANTTWWWAILAFFQFIWRYYVSEVRHNDGVWRAYGWGGRLHHQEKERSSGATTSPRLQQQRCAAAYWGVGGRLHREAK